MAPIFEQRIEDLNRDIAVLTAVMDGQGYLSDSGTHGRRGYSGDFRFGMIGATTPLPNRAWETLGKLGSRWLFYRLEDTLEQDIDLRDDYSENLKVCKMCVKEYLKGFWKGFGSVTWDKAKDEKKWTDLLLWTANQVARWRGIIRRQDTGYNPPMVEMPLRMAQTLYALARGHALLNGRSQLSWEDAAFVVNISYGNMPEDRARLFKAFFEAGKDLVITNGGFKNPECNDIVWEACMTQGAIARALGCSDDKAIRVIEELEALEVIEKVEKGFQLIN